MTWSLFGCVQIAAGLITGFVVPLPHTDREIGSRAVGARKRGREMLDQFELIVCTAFATFVVTQLGNAMIARRTAMPSAAAQIPAAHAGALAASRNAPKLKKMIPAQIAERVVANIRTSDLSVYPFLPNDLDQIIVEWCASQNVELSSTNIVRELIAELPGVKRNRPWLNLRNEIHQTVRRRQIIHGEVNDRPTLYWIGDVSDFPTRDRTEANARPSAVQTDRTRVQTGVGHGPEVRPDLRRCRDVEPLERRRKVA